MKTGIVAIMLVSFFVLPLIGLAEEPATVPKSVQAAIEASDLCYHWAEENGDQTPERNQFINRGFERDCPAAKQKAAEAYRRFPANEYLALALLKLNDIGYFDLSAAEKAKLCKRGALLLISGFYESNGQDGYFKAFCPQPSKK